MAPFRRWADLPPDLLCRIGDRLDLKWYASARGACTAWRCALAPPSPALLVVADDARWCPYAASLPTRRSFELTAIVSGSRCVGSSNGWLALSVVLYNGQTVFVLLNPIAAAEILLPPLIYESRWVSKVVFTPTPAKDDFAAAAICDIDRIAYVTAGARRWAVMDPVRLTCGDQLTDVVYTDTGKVYCLTKCGDVHVLRLPERRVRKPASNNADEAGPSEPEFSVLQPQSDRTMNFRPVRWLQQRNLRLLRYEQARARDPHDPIPLMVTLCADTFMSYKRAPPESQGPDLNAPATIEPLLSEANLPFNPATVFAPPYDMGRPGVGKTTVMREIARALADEFQKRVVIVDTSNEIGGDGDIPHAAIGGARRMQVPEPSMQHRVMIEAVENHMPEVVIVDEIGTEAEAQACRSIAERGVMLIGTAHGERLANIIKNPTLSDLIGGVETVTLGDDEARARRSQKSILERKAPPTFPFLIEMRERHYWVTHRTERSVDMLLHGKKPLVEVRKRDNKFQVVIERWATYDGDGL